MGNHEIRLRRKNMTSRKIDRHKNYYEIMRRHNKRRHSRRIAKILIYIIFLLGLVVIFYFAVDKLENINTNENEVTRGGSNEVEIIYSDASAKEDLTYETVTKKEST